MDQSGPPISSHDAAAPGEGPAPLPNWRSGTLPGDSIPVPVPKPERTRDREVNESIYPTLQQTIAAPVLIEGKGIFLGVDCACTFLPAPPDHGIVFERIDLGEPVRIPADIGYVSPSARRTTLRVGAATVETTEHCLSALAGLGIDNVLIRITAPELPGVDGSAKPYVDALRNVGIVQQQATRRYFRILEAITVSEGESVISITPSETNDLQIVYDLDYGTESPIGQQFYKFRLGESDYSSAIAPARTFCLKQEADALWERGLCKHLTPRDVLVIGPDGPIDNAYRFPNELVRHKILDLIGDISLLGVPIQGRIMAYRSGHALNHQFTLKLRDHLRKVQGLDAVGEVRSIDIRGIMKLMRHRYPMLMVDRVVEIEGDRRAVGVKNVSVNEPFFQGHYPGRPIMPGVLVVEAMAQLSGLLLSRVLEHTGRIAILLALDRVKLRRPVHPGDQLIMEAEAVHAQTRTANVKCRAFVAGQLAAEAQIKFMMVDAEDEAAM